MAIRYATSNDHVATTEQIQQAANENADIDCCLVMSDVDYDRMCDGDERTLNKIAQMVIGDHPWTDVTYDVDSSDIDTVSITAYVTPKAL